MVRRILLKRTSGSGRLLKSEMFAGNLSDSEGRYAAIVIAECLVKLGCRVSIRCLSGYPPSGFKGTVDIDHTLKKLAESQPNEPNT